MKVQSTLRWYGIHLIHCFSFLAAVFICVVALLKSSGLLVEWWTKITWRGGGRLGPRGGVGFGSGPGQVPGVGLCSRSISRELRLAEGKSISVTPKTSSQLSHTRFIKRRLLGCRRTYVPSSMMAVIVYIMSSFAGHLCVFYKVFAGGCIFFGLPTQLASLSTHSPPLICQSSAQISGHFLL